MLVLGKTTSFSKSNKISKSNKNLLYSVFFLVSVAMISAVFFDIIINLKFLQTYKQMSTKKIKPSEKLNAILTHLKISANKFSIEIGLDNNTKVYHLKKDRNDISPEMANTIINRYPEFSYNWLVLGTGEMLNETPTFKPEGKIINEDELPKKQVTIIPIKGRGGLENAFFDKLYINELEKEELTLKYPSSKGSEWFKIEIEGISMDDSTKDFEGSRYSLQEGDWAYCRSIPRLHWKNKLHFNSVKVFCFFHNTRGIIFKKVISHNIETGELVLHSLNKDKKKFPDFTINIAECSYICNVLKVLSDF